MIMQFKDVVTTLLAFVVIGIYIAVSKGVDFPLLTSYRWLIVILGIIGISMCAFGSSGNTISTSKDFLVVVLSILGVFALFFTTYGLITGTRLSYTLLSFIIVLMWLLSTARHMFIK